MSRSNIKKLPTMNDVATLAGVSQTTVSFVLNKVTTVNISEETRNRVLAAIKQTGYRPNAGGKLLRTNRSHIIGLVTDAIASTPFAGDIIRGAQEAAWSHGKLLMIVNTGYMLDVEEPAIEFMLERRIEGIIYATMGHNEVNPPDTIREVPNVLLNCFSSDRSLPSVVPDEVGGGRSATEILLSKGHRRIGFINIGENIPAAVGRLVGYKEALLAQGIAFEPELVRGGNSFADSGYTCTKELMGLTEPPTAIFCGTDRTAMGAYDALREMGLSIPADVAVVGFDNQEIIAAYLRPSLTTIALPFYEMGQWAVNNLIEQIGELEVKSPTQHQIACPIVLRESV